MVQNNTNDSTNNWIKIIKAAQFEGSLNENDIIGEGGFGQVFRYKDSFGNLFALKRLWLRDELNAYVSPPIDLENIDLLRSLRHKNIVKFYDLKRGKQTIYLFFEFLDGGNLRNLLQTLKKNNKVLPEQTVKRYTIQMILGLQYLHTRKIVHRDVKPDNVMLNAEQTVVKLTDFGLSKQISSTCAMFTKKAKGTYHYMAPEVVRCESFSLKSDIWSLGATLVEMLTGNPPFAYVQNGEQVKKYIAQLGVTELKPDYDSQDLSDVTQELLDKILQPFPAVRPSAAALLALDYFSSEDVIDSYSDDDSEYSMAKDYRGRILIINNVKYEKQAKRVGPKVDAARLQDTFEAIGFKVVPQTDLSASKMLESLKAFVFDNQNECYSSFIIIILAYGCQTGVFGVDEKILRFKEILQVLSCNSAELLRNKPKILIIQACSSLYAATYQNEAAKKSAKATNSSNLFSSVSSTTKETQRSVNVEAALQSDETCDRPTSTSRIAAEYNVNGLDKDSAVPIFAGTKKDILVAYSVCCGYEADRCKDDGSIFIQSVCDAVQKYWLKISLLDMLAIASGKVASTAVSTSTKPDELQFQIPQVKSTLLRRFFLSHESERATTNGRNQVVQARTGKTQNLLTSTVAISNLRTSLAQMNVKSRVFDFTAASNAVVDPKLTQSRTATTEKKSNVLPRLMFSPLQTCKTLASTTPRATLHEHSPAIPAADLNAAVASELPLIPEKLMPTQQQKQVLILAGGFNRKETLAYDPSSDTWAQVASMSCERSVVAATLWQGKVVVAGGCISTDNFLNTVEMYDPETNSWTVLPDMKHDRCYLALACFDNSLFAIGGSLESSSVERYNSDTKQWNLAAPLNNGRAGLSCAVLEVGILAAGGWDGSKGLNTCELFDRQQHEWKFVASLQSARYLASAAAVTQDKRAYVYVFGGEDKELKAMDSIEQYDCATDMWTLLSVRMSVARWALAAATLNGRIYVCGGTPPGGRVVECFDARKGQIYCVSPLLETVWYCAAVAVPVNNQLHEKLFQNTFNI